MSVISLPTPNEGISQYHRRIATIEADVYLSIIAVTASTGQAVMVMAVRLKEALGTEG